MNRDELFKVSARYDQVTLVFYLLFFALVFLFCAANTVVVSGVWGPATMAGAGIGMLSALIYSAHIQSFINACQESSENADDKMIQCRYVNWATQLSFVATVASMTGRIVYAI